MLEKGWGNEIKPWLSCSSVALVLASIQALWLQYPALDKPDAVVTAEFKGWGQDAKEFQASLGYGASCLKKQNK